MDGDDWESSSGEGLNDNELCLDDESCTTNGPLPKLQFRKRASKARWSDEIGMAEVTEKKGQIWVSTGIVRNSKTYCFLEEALYLAEIGALLLLDYNGTSLSLEDIYSKVTQEKGGCYMELCMVYRHLKFLGYIIRRHNVPWTLKNLKGNGESGFSNGNYANNGIADKLSKDVNFVTEHFGSMKINEVRPIFDVYLPNSTFKKTSPGDPEFILCSTGVCPPTKADIEVLETQSGNIPLRFCHVEPARITFFSFDKVCLPQLP